MAALPPDPHPRPPKQPIPAGACDTHMHIYGPAVKYAYIADRDYTPPDALMPDYLAMRNALGLDRTVVIQPSVYGQDHACTADAVAALGDAGRGVAVVDADVADEELARLHAIGFRGARFNLVNRGGIAPNRLEAVAARAAEIGWHLQIMVLGAELADLAPRLAKLPVDVVVDHIGRMTAAGGPAQPGFQALLGLVEAGRCWVKLSGAYRVDFGGAPWPDARPFVDRLIALAPDKLVWATDWAHPDLGTSPMPNDGDLLNALIDWCDGDADLLRAILVDNPARLYDF